MVDQLKEQLQQKEKELKTLHQVAEYLSSNLGIEEILSHIIEIAAELTGADSCLIYLYEPGREVLTLKSSKNPHPEVLEKIRLKVGEGVTGWVAKEKKPVIIGTGAYKDPRFKKFNELPEDEYEAFLSIPILFKEELAGVINIQHKAPADYPDYQVKLLGTIAKYLGTSVHNAIARDEVQKKAEQLDILSKISGTIISDNYIKEVLQLIVTMTAQLMDSKICSIMLLDEKSEELIIAATQSLSDDYVNKPNLKVGQSVSGEVVLDKKSITVKDVTREKNYVYPEVAKKEGIVSMLAVPMMIKDRVIGVINSYTEEEHEFTPEEIGILQAIANQAAVTIENTRLSDEILKAKEELETRKVIERAKGIMMRDMNISESEAYKKLQKKSMDLRKSMKELAEAVVLASDMKDFSGSKSPE